MKLREWQNKDGSISYFIDYRAGGKRRRHLLKDIHSRELAEFAAADFKVRMEREAAGLASEPNLSLSGCLKAFLESKQANCGKRHIANLKSRIAQMEAFLGAETPIKTLDERGANTFRAYLREEGDQPPTINKKLGILKSAIGLAVRRRKIMANPLEGLENLSDSRKPVWRFLKPEEVERLLAVLQEGTEVVIKRKNGRKCTMQLGKNPRLYELAAFLLNSGARVGEAMALSWRDIDLERKVVTLHTTKRAARGRRAFPRHIPLNHALMDLLTAMAKEAKGREKVFTIGKANITARFEKACRYAGLGHCRVHDCRHTFASGLAMAGVPLNTIRELLGHSSMAMVLRYAHLAPSATAEAVESLNYGAQGKVARVVSIGEATG